MGSNRKIAIKGFKNDMMLLIPCIFLHALYQPTNALSKIQFVTSIKLLHVSAPECHPQGFYLKKKSKSSTQISLLIPLAGIIKILKF